MCQTLKTEKIEFNDSILIVQTLINIKFKKY